MKPAVFQYCAVDSEDELLGALSTHGGDARLLAGGQSLVPMMNFRVVNPAVLIDINRLSQLCFIKVSRDAIEIGALTRHAMLEDSEELRARLPLVGEAMSHLGHRAIRNRGTLGGSLAFAYPNAELPLLMVTLGAELRLRSPRRERSLSASEFIIGPLTTALEEDEFIRTACIPLPPPAAGSAFVEVVRRHGDFGLAAAAAIIELAPGGTIAKVQVGVSGGRGVPLRLPSLEYALVGEKPTPELFDSAARAAIGELEIDDDRQIPAGYRRLLLETVLQRVLMTAAERAERRHDR